MQERGNAVRAVLSRLASVAPQSQSPEVAELQSRCHQLADEASLLRQKSLSAEEQLRKTSEDIAELTESLRRAERKVDRLQSRSVQLSERPSTKAEEEAEKAKLEAAEAEHKAALQRKEAADASANGSAAVTAAAVNGEQSGANREELEQAQALAQTRLEENESLRSEVIQLRQQCEKLQLDLHRIPEERTRETSLYRDLHGHFTHAQQELERFKGIHDAIESENVELREKRLDFQAAAQREGTSVADQLREQLKLRDADLVRLRTERDGLLWDVADRKQREGVKFAQCDEMKKLVAAKDTRIETLRSEVRRLQMTLAAQAGNDRLLEQLKNQQQQPAESSADAGESHSGSNGSGGEDVELIASLMARLKAAEETSADLKRQLDARSSSTSEADLLAKVSNLEAQLNSLTVILGKSNAEGEEAVSGEEVAARLRSQELRVSQLTSELAAANESTTALCDEVEKLSRAYSDMDAQSRSKVMDLSRMEDKVLRLTMEKAKADNKYFGAARAKDGVEGELRTAKRTVEAQGSALEGMKRAEEGFKVQATMHEREVTQLRRIVAACQQRQAEVERDLAAARAREHDAVQARRGVEERLNAALAEAEQEKGKRQRLAESQSKLERDAERAKKAAATAAAKASSSSSGSAGGAAEEIDFLQTLLRCSSCKDRYRDKILDKCKHTFCSPCLESRVATRQRKCPHCAASFAVSDVQPLYFQ